MAALGAIGQYLGLYPSLSVTNAATDHTLPQVSADFANFGDENTHSTSVSSELTVTVVRGCSGYEPRPVAGLIAVGSSS